MSVHQVTVTELNTQQSTTNVADKNGAFASTKKDEKGTPPVRLEPAQTQRLRLMFLTSSYLRMANEEMKNALFSHPFDVFLGADKQNVLKETFKESIVNEYWMPALKKIHDWLLQFGIAPYIIRPTVFPSIVPQFNIGAFRKANAKTVSSRETPDDEGDDVDDEPKQKKRNDNDDSKPPKTPVIMKASSSSPGEKKSTAATSASNDNMVYTSYGQEVHNIIDVLDFEAGFISTYVDSKFKQQFIWTWHPTAVPQTFDSSDGYTDASVKFIVKDPPTIKGDYTCPLRTAIKAWLYVNSRKKMDSLSMRDRLNPILFVEKQEAHAAKTPSVIDELSVNYSSAFNTGKLNYQRPDGPGIDPNSGELNLGYGKSVKIDTTRIDGLADVGLMTYADGYGNAMRNTEGPDYATLLSTLEFNRRATGASDRHGPSNSPFGFGGINDDELTTDLGGFVTTYGNDPIMTNPMSGIGYRVKTMRENEKLIELKNKELDAYVNTATIEQQEKALEENLCFLAGYPASFISGRSGKTSGASGGAKGTSTTTTASSVTATSSDNNVSKDFLIGRLRHFKFYYQHQITKLFLQCYSKSFIKSKLKLLNQLDENYWFILEQVYALQVDLPVDPPPTDLSNLKDNFGSGIVTLEEVVRNVRLNMGLSLDVLDDPEFMARAKEKMENKYDMESQLQLQQKYAVKSDKGGSAKAAGSKPKSDKDKKRKASSSLEKKSDGKKPKK